MKITKMLGVAAIAAMALMAFASTASATTLEVTNVTQTSSITIHATATSSVLLSATGGGFANTCTESTVHGHTAAPFTKSTRIPMIITVLSFGNCANPVTVHEPGSLEVENISGSTNGTLFSKNAKVTTGSPFGTLTCTTPAGGTHIGTLTAGTPAIIHVNAVLNCGFFLPSAKWEGTYTVTSPHNLGVEA